MMVTPIKSNIQSTRMGSGPGKTVVEKTIAIAQDALCGGIDNLQGLYVCGYLPIINSFFISSVMINLTMRRVSGNSDLVGYTV